MKIIRTRDALLLAKMNHDVQEIHHDIEPEIFKAYSEENMKNMFEELLQNHDTSAYLVYDGNDLAGYMLLSRVDKKEDFFKESYSVIHIDQICIEAAFQGKGIGKALVDFAKDYGKSLKISRLEMNYWTKNKNSGDFFRSQGFENYNERLFISI